jgi:hypothetical protein
MLVFYGRAKPTYVSSGHRFKQARRPRRLRDERLPTSEDDWIVG